jgi:hypothetical protein
MVFGNVSMNCRDIRKRVWSQNARALNVITVVKVSDVVISFPLFVLRLRALNKTYPS